MAIETRKQLSFLTQIVKFAGILLAFASVATMILSERVARMGRRTWWVAIRWAFLIAVGGLLVLPAKAAFVNGVERFDGTSLDLSTWERYDPAVSTFSQNDALTISGNGSYSDYTTKSITVGIGQRVSAEVTLNVPPETSTIYAAALLLTTNSGGTGTDTFHDFRYFGCRVVFGNAQSSDARFFQALYGDPQGYGFSTEGEGIPVAGTTYILSVARVARAQIEISASTSDRTLIFTYAAALPEPPPDDLFISLHRTNLRFFLNDSATFDNVTITAVPEPALTATCFATLLLVRLARVGKAS